MKDLKLRFNHWLMRHPLSCLGILLIIMAVLLPGWTKLYKDFSFKALYKTDDPLLDLYEEFEATFGNDDSIMLALIPRQGVLNSDFLRSLRQVTEQMWMVKDIKRVDSLINYEFITVDGDDIQVFHINDIEEDRFSKQQIETIKNFMDQDRNLEGFLMDKKRQLTMLIGQIRNTHQSQYQVDYMQMFDDVDQIVQKAFHGQEVKVHFMGAVAFQKYYQDLAFSDLLFLVPLMSGIFAVLLLVIYRSLWGVILPFAVMFLSLVGLVGFMGHMGFSINSLSSVCPAVLMTIAMADSVHILTSFFLAASKGHTLTSSLSYSLNKNFGPTLLTSITTAVGFYSFSTATVKPIAQLGMAIAFGVLLTWVISYLIFPPFLQWIYRKKYPQNEKELEHPDHFINHIETSSGSQRFVAWLERFKLPTLILSVLLFFGSLSLMGKLEVNLYPLKEFPSDHPANTAMVQVEEKLGAATGLEMMIDSGAPDGIKEPAFMRKVDDFAAWLENRPAIHNTISIHHTIKQLNQRLHQDLEEFYRIPETRELIAQELFFFNLGLPPGRELNNRISTHHQKIRLTAQWDIHNSKDALKEIKVINQEIKKRDLDAVVTGKTPMLHSLNPYIVKIFLQSFSMALILITIILIIVLKSIKLGLMALMPNVFPICLGAALFYLSGNQVDIASVLIASVCLGVAVDDSIHFLFEYQKYRRLGQDTHQAVASVMTTTFPSLLHTTFIIVVGFGSFLLAEYIPNQKFGVFSSIILCLALVADVTILPVVLFYTEKIRSKSFARPA